MNIPVRRALRGLLLSSLGLAPFLALPGATTAQPRRGVRRFTGAEGGFGKALGIPRGLNQLWNMGGVLYAPPLR